MHAYIVSWSQCLAACEPGADAEFVDGTHQIVDRGT